MKREVQRLKYLSKPILSASYGGPDFIPVYTDSRESIEL
jgi:hypothetical protein